MHYHSGVNLFMLSRMANHLNRLTAANIDEYFNRVINLALDYEINCNFREMIPMLKKEEREEFRGLLRKQRKRNHRVWKEKSENSASRHAS